MVMGYRLVVLDYRVVAGEDIVDVAADHRLVMFWAHGLSLCSGGHRPDACGCRVAEPGLDEPAASVATAGAPSTCTTARIMVTRRPGPGPQPGMNRG